MGEYRELLIGCGHRREKLLGLPGEKLEWRGLVTLDQNIECAPDLLVDLNSYPWGSDFDRNGVVWKDKRGEVQPMRQDKTVLDFPVLGESVYDEVHAYEVLEHLGSQGDAVAFFACFSEIYRLLRPGGCLFATVPSRYSGWLWGDPSHRRVILPESLVFLVQPQYTAQCDGPNRTPMSDFRNLYQADFDIVASTDDHTSHTFCLRAVKPSRIHLKGGES